MSQTKIESTSQIKVWDEKEASEGPTGITRTHVVRTYAGGMQGESIADYVFAYHSGRSKSEGLNAVCTYNGFARFKGTLDGVEGEGELVLETKGSFNLNGDHTAVAEWKIVEAASEGAFKGLKGTGGYEANAKTNKAWLHLA